MNRNHTIDIMDGVELALEMPCVSGSATQLASWFSPHLRSPAASESTRCRDHLDVSRLQGK